MDDVLDKEFKVYSEDMEAVFAILNLPTEAEKTVKKYLSDHWGEISVRSREAYEGEGPDFPICRRKPLTRLALITYLLAERKYFLESKHIDERIIASTFQDVTLRVKLYYQRFGKVGLSKEDACWHRHIVRSKIFKIGELQFQDFDMIYLDREGIGEDYMEFNPEQKKCLPKGSPVVNIHIQRGAKLDIDSVKNSLEEARAFFREFFPERAFRSFICCSWLLYPDMDGMLPEHSNIRDFRNLFHIIGQAKDPDEAIRDIFGKRYRSKKNYPQNTSLQISALRSFENLGVAFGIIDF